MKDSCLPGKLLFHRLGFESELTHAIAGSLAVVDEREHLLKLFVASLGNLGSVGQELALEI